MGSHSLLQGIFPTQGSNLDLLNCRQILHSLSHQGSPSTFFFRDGAIKILLAFYCNGLLTDIPPAVTSSHCASRWWSHPWEGGTRDTQSLTFLRLQLKDPTSVGSAYVEDLTLILPGILLLDGVYGEFLPVLGQEDVLCGFYILAVEDPLDADVSFICVTGNDHLVLFISVHGVADLDGGLLQQTCGENRGGD